MSDDEAAALGRALGEAIKLFRARGWEPPRPLAEWRQLLAGSAKYRANAQVSTGGGTGEFRDDLAVPRSEEPARLTVKEAANLAGVSEGYMRRLIRRGDVTASRGHRRAWAVDIASLAAWISSRRKQRDRRAA